MSRLQEHILPSVETVMRLCAFCVPTTFTQYTGCWKHINTGNQRAILTSSQTNFSCRICCFKEQLSSHIIPGEYKTQLLPDRIFFFFLHLNFKRHIMEVEMFSKFHFPHNKPTQLSNAVKILNYVDEISPTGICIILLMAFDTENNRQKEVNCPNEIKMKTLFKKTAA